MTHCDTTFHPVLSPLLLKPCWQFVENPAITNHTETQSVNTKHIAINKKNFSTPVDNSPADKYTPPDSDPPPKIESLHFSLSADFLLNCQLKYQKEVEGQETVTFKPVDIREVFESKNPRLAKLMPGVVYRYLKKILHIDFLNDLLKRTGHLKGVAFVDEVVKEFEVKEFVHGIENVPSSGRFIFASNHPLGGFDGMLLLRNVNKLLGKPKFLTNDILMNIPNLRPMFVPVNKHGGHSREAARIIDRTYRSDEQILIFPSGLASRKIKGKIVDLDWKKHFISKATQYKRDVIPVFISGRNTDRFYRLAKLRKFFRIKWNLEMFFLPDETVKHRGSDVHIYFGKPIPHTFFNKEKTQKEWAGYVKSLVYNLPAQQGN